MSLYKQLIVKFLLLVFAVMPKICIAQYGESCASLPADTIDKYMVSSTAYGYLVNNIDMKKYIDKGCKGQPQKGIKFCIKNQGDADCTKIEMSEGQKQLVSAISSNPEIGGDPYIGKIELSVDRVGQNLCLTMATARGLMPLVCNPGYWKAQDDSGEEIAKCSSISSACYRTTRHSQSLLDFSGITVECLTDSLKKIFFVGTGCAPSADDQLSSIAPFAEFQESLKTAIRIAFVLYVIFYGFKVLMNPEESMDFKTVGLFVLKLVFVAYFAVGLGPLTFQFGGQKQANGMTDIALPFLVDATAGFAKMVFKAVGAKGLCEFDATKYDRGYEYYGLWDAIDCRLGFYLGMQAIYNKADIFDNLSSSSNDLGRSGNAPMPDVEVSDDAPDSVKDPFNMNIFSVMFGFFMSGNIIVVISSFFFALMFISIMFYFLTAYIVCVITLYVLAYISPIFITFSLFERTKAYFDSWLKIVISCVLQPAVIGGFVAIIVTMYDATLYGNCEFKRHDYQVNSNKFSTFELRIPNSFSSECTTSPGYKLAQYYMGAGWEERMLVIFSVPVLKDMYKLSSGLVYILIFSFIFYYIMKYVNEFASDLTSGPSLEAVTAAPNKLITAAMSAASSISNLANGLGKGMGRIKKSNTSKSPGSKGGKGRKGATDKVSSGGGKGSSGGGAKDKMSFGGSGSKGGASSSSSGGKV